MLRWMPGSRRSRTQSTAGAARCISPGRNGSWAVRVSRTTRPNGPAQVLRADRLAEERQVGGEGCLIRTVRPRDQAVPEHAGRALAESVEADGIPGGMEPCPLACGPVDEASVDVAHRRPPGAVPAR